MKETMAIQSEIEIGKADGEKHMFKTVTRHLTRGINHKQRLTTAGSNTRQHGDGDRHEPQQNVRKTLNQEDKNHKIFNENYNTTNC